MLSYRARITAVPLATGAGIVAAFIIFVLALTEKPMILFATYDGFLLLLPIVIPAIAVSAGIYSKLIGDRKAVYVLLLCVGALLCIGYFAFLWLYATSSH
jgi:hypothetical protein